MRDDALEYAFARRDAAAYDAAYRQFGPRMYTTALRIMRNPEAAYECVQEVMLRLWRRGDAYVAARGSLEAFLVTCCRNEALAHVRSDARRARILKLSEREGDASMDPDPAEHERVAAAIAKLTPAQAEIVQRLYYQGMTLNEIAHELQEPIGTIKSRLAAALRSLRRLLVDEDSDG